ncbi:unnamed protein product [Symbiodinium sp. CCMP2592]|nr:unnamed protein product [Symbiodinium sp. CCMP2592]
MQTSSIVAVACVQGISFAVPPHTASAGDELLCRDEWEFVRKSAISKFRNWKQSSTSSETLREWASHQVETFKVSGCRPGQLVLRLLSIADHEVCDVTAGFLSHHWWSEMLLTKWSSLLFWAAFDLLQATAKEVPSGVGRCACRRICRMVGHASRHVERRHRLVRVKALTRQLISDAPQNPAKALQSFAREIDKEQRAWMHSDESGRSCWRRLRDLLLSLRMSAKLLSLSGMQQPSWRQGWWMPRNAVDSTAGWSQAWVVFSCADEPLVNMLSCDPLIEEASRSPFLSRQRVFVATRHPAEMHRLKKLPFVEVMSVEEAAEFANAAHWSLAYYQDMMMRAIRLRDSGPSLVVFVDVQFSEDALAQLWDLDRWLLHRQTDPGSRSAWDIAWVAEDGFSPGAALLPCEASKSQGADVKWLVPKAGLLLMKPSMAALQILHELKSQEAHAVQGSTVSSAWGSFLIREWRARDWYQTEYAYLDAAKPAPQWRDIQLPQGAVRSIGASQLRMLASPGRAASLQLRWALHQCEHFSEGSGYCHVGPLKPRGFGFLVEPCGFPNFFSPGRHGGSAADVQADRLEIQLKASQEVFLCPRRVPVAILAVPRAGSTSVANWAGLLDGVDSWLSAAGHSLQNAQTLWKPEDKDFTVWGVQHFCLRCCRAGVQRLHLVVMRSPFDRLKSHFHRSQVSRGGKWSDFPGWWRWAATMLRSGSMPSCAYSRNFSNYEWSMSDEYHLRPVHRILARAGMPMEEFWHAAELSDRRDAMRAADASAASQAIALQSHVQQVVVLRLERLAADLALVQRLLCSRWLWCRVLQDIPRTHTSQGARKIEELAWSSQSIRWVTEVYAKDLWLGRYAKVPIAQPQDAAFPFKPARIVLFTWCSWPGILLCKPGTTLCICTGVNLCQCAYRARDAAGTGHANWRDIPKCNTTNTAPCRRSKDREAETLTGSDGWEAGSPKT